MKLAQISKTQPGRNPEPKSRLVRTALLIEGQLVSRAPGSKGEGSPKASGWLRP